MRLVGLGGFLLALYVGATAALSADLTITVQGVRSNNGTLRLALFDSPREFPRGEKLVGHDIKALVGELTVVFEGLAAGRYALAVHHDENDNGEMDTGLLGIPQEGFAFSNDALVFLGAPPFADAVFELPDEGRHIVIQMDY